MRDGAAELRERDVELRRTRRDEPSHKKAMQRRERRRRYRARRQRRSYEGEERTEDRRQRHRVQVCERGRSQRAMPLRAYVLRTVLVPYGPLELLEACHEIGLARPAPGVRGAHCAPESEAACERGVSGVERVRVRGPARVLAHGGGDGEYFRIQDVFRRDRAII